MSEKPRTGRLGGFELLAHENADFAHRLVMMLRDNAIGDSPIEKIFHAALITVAGWHSHNVNHVLSVRPGASLEQAKEEMHPATHPTATAFIESQVQIAGWRVDFLIHYPLASREIDGFGYPKLGRIIVECDGHAFHERTQDQAARDRSRDRMAQHEGIPIFRFTGSEIWNNPTGCAYEVLSFMERT